MDGFLDLHYKPAALNQKLTLSAGGVLRDKKRDNFYNTYTFTPNVNEPFTDIYGATWQNNNGPQNPLGNVNNPNTYSANEHIDAGYLMADWQVGRSEFNAGIRFEQTKQNFVSALDPTVSYGKTVNISYSDWLPDFRTAAPCANLSTMRNCWRRYRNSPAPLYYSLRGILSLAGSRFRVGARYL